MTKEKRQTKKKETSKKLSLIWRFLKGSKGFFVAGIIAAAITALCNMLKPQIIRFAVDDVITGTSTTEGWMKTLADSFGGAGYLKEHLWIIAAMILVVAAVEVLTQYLNRVFNTKAAETLVKTMRDSLFCHIQSLPFGWHMKNKTGDIIQRCTSDIDTVKNFVSEQLTSILRIAILLTFSVAFMLSMNPLLALIAILPMPIILIYSFRFHRGIGEGFMKCDESEGRLSAMVQENLTGVRVVRAFGRESFEREKFHNHNEEYTGLWVKLARIMSRFWSTADILSGLQIMLVVIFGAVFAIDGDMTAGEFIAFISYNQMLVWPIRMLGRMISELSKAGVSIDRVRYIMESEPEKDKEISLCPDMTGDIEFKNVNFGYEGCPEILHDISFSVKSGTTLGILGGTGSGKSTLMFLLDKLYGLTENSGSITVGGVDISNINTEHLRKNIGIVLQEPFLFSRTIAENIGITDQKLSLADIRSAAKAACLDDTVISFAKGYDTFVGERGVTLSGGQKQRAAIARILTGNNPIMIFDDSLSAVDTETDAKIRASLEERFGSATIIIISHRITTLQKADKILVLDKGRIAEQGTHEELLKMGGIYRKISDIQQGVDEEVAE